MLEPTGEEAGTDQLVDLVLVAEPWPAVAVAAHFSGLLACLVAVIPFLLPSPNHRAAAANILRAAAAGFGIEGVGFLQV